MRKRGERDVPGITIVGEVSQKRERGDFTEA